MHSGSFLSDGAVLSVYVAPAGYEDDKVQLPFSVTDLKGRNLQLVTGAHSGQVHHHHHHSSSVLRTHIVTNGQSRVQSSVVAAEMYAFI